MYNIHINIDIYYNTKCKGHVCLYRLCMHVWRSSTSRRLWSSPETLLIFSHICRRRRLLLALLSYIYVYKCITVHFSPVHWSRPISLSLSLCFRCVMWALVSSAPSPPTCRFSNMRNETNGWRFYCRSATVLLFRSLSLYIYMHLTPDVCMYILYIYCIHLYIRILRLLLCCAEGVVCHIPAEIARAYIYGIYQHIL